MKRNIARLLLSLLVVLACARAGALTFDDLKNDPKMTPRRFASYCSDFIFQYNREVQPPDTFFRTRMGDCDDYAVAADIVLRAKGYKTRLIQVGFADAPSHAVCYVAEEKGYLDYNNRAYFIKVEHSGPSLEQIAAKVAKSFHSQWTYVCEFTYDDGRKHMKETVFKFKPTKTELASARR